MASLQDVTVSIGADTKQAQKELDNLRKRTEAAGTASGTFGDRARAAGRKITAAAAPVSAFNTLLGGTTGGANKAAAAFGSLASAFTSGGVVSLGLTAGTMAIGALVMALTKTEEKTDDAAKAIREKLTQAAQDAAKEVERLSADLLTMGMSPAERELYAATQRKIDLEKELDKVYRDRRDADAERMKAERLGNIDDAKKYAAEKEAATFKLGATKDQILSAGELVALAEIKLARERDAESLARSVATVEREGLARDKERAEWAKEQAKWQEEYEDNLIRGIWERLREEQAAIDQRVQSEIDAAARIAEEDIKQDAIAHQAKMASLKEREDEESRVRWEIAYETKEISDAERDRAKDGMQETREAISAASELALTGLEMMARGEANAMQTVLLGALDVIGTKLVAAGIEDVAKGAGILILSKGTDLSGAAMVGLGLLEAAIGTGMKAGRVYGMEQLQALAGKSSSSSSTSGGTGGIPQSSSNYGGGGGVTINITQGMFARPEDTARELRRMWRLGDRRGIQ